MIQHFTVDSLKRSFTCFGWSIVLYSTIAAAVVATHLSPTLQSFDGRVVSGASVGLVDISARLNIYIFAVATFIAVAVVLYLLVQYVLSILEPVSIPIEGLSKLGFGFLFFFIFMQPTTLILLLLFIALSHLVIASTRFLLPRVYTDENNTEGVLVWIGVLSLALVTALGLLGTFSSNSAFLVAWACTAMLVTAAVRILTRHQPIHSAVPVLATIGAPLAAIPVLWFAANELYLIANQHAIAFPSAQKLFVVGLLFIVVLMVAGLPLVQRFKTPSLFSMLSWWYGPIILLGVFVIVFYSPTLYASSDFFEPANPGLLIQQFFDFRAIPYIERFNAHGFSDALWGFLYTLFNGLQDAGWGHYDFLQRAIEAVLVYFLTTRLSRKPSIGFVAVAFLPFVDLLFPPYFTSAIIILLALVHAVRRKTTGAVIVLELVLVGAFFWRFDVGYSAIIATLVLFAWSQWRYKSERVPLASLWKGSLISGAVVLALTMPAFIAAGVSPLVWIKDFLHITNSSQVFGYTTIATSVDIQFIVHYFLIPLIIVCGLLATFYKEAVSRRQYLSLLHATLFFGSFFYLTNFMRGLVRHSLFEGVVYYVSSFGIALAIIYVIHYFVKVQNKQRLVVGMVLGAVFCYNFSYVAATSLPISENLDQTLFEKFVDSVQTADFVQPSPTPIDRTVVPPELKANSYDDFLAFVETELTPSQTFLDISNSPLLYYYTHKEQPYLTNHLMLMSDEYLQGRVLEQIQAYDIPLVVFAYVPPFTYNLDLVPFQARFYKIAEYIYDHYRPYTILDSREVWVRNDWQPTNALQAENATGSARPIASNVRPPSNFTASPDASILPTDSGIVVHTVGLDPYLYDTLIDDASTTLQAETPYAIHLVGSSTTGGSIQIFFQVDSIPYNQNHSTTVDVPPGPVDVKISIPSFSTVRVLNDIRVDIPPGDRFTLAKLELTASVYSTPELLQHSTLPQDFALGHVPYLWGTYDPISTQLPPALRSAEQLSSSQLPVTVTTTRAADFQFTPLTIDERLGGHYILVRAVTPKGVEKGHLLLTYGEDGVDRGTVRWATIPDGQEHLYLIRISSQYHWKQFQVDEFNIISKDQNIDITDVAILPGD